MILLRPVKPRFMENAMKLEFAVLKAEETLDKTTQRQMTATNMCQVNTMKFTAKNILLHVKQIQFECFGYTSKPCYL